MSVSSVYGDMVSRVSVVESKFGGYQEGNAVHREHKRLGKTDAKLFTEKFVQIVDSVIVGGNIHFFTKDQEKFFDRYLLEADTVLSDEMVQFDNFLGSYREVSV